MDIHDLKIFLMIIRKEGSVFQSIQIALYDTAGEQVRY